MVITPNEPYPFDAFADLLDEHDLTVVPGSGRWLPHPTEEGREIWGVAIKEQKMSDKLMVRWARQLLTRNFMILDVETTGLGDDDEVVSVGLVDNNGDVLMDSLVCHTRECSPAALATHGITRAMTENAPPFSDVYQELVDWLSDADIVIGYNLDFDTRIIDQTCQRYGLEPIADLTDKRLAGDVMQAFAKFYGDWNDYHQSYTWQKLTTAAQHFGLSVNGAHGAAADALLTLGVIKGIASDDDYQAKDHPVLQADR